jgi:hypothetical protein
MTLGELLQIGDEVVFKVDPETRHWTNTYKDVPDGTKGVVCRIRDTILYYGRTNVFVRAPGVYHTKGGATVLLPDGRLIPGNYSITMTDQVEAKRRDALKRDSRGVFQETYTRLGDLPSTPFWEEDKVLVHREDGDEQLVVKRIYYDRLHDRNKDGSLWSVYEVHHTDGWQTGASADNMELIERGNVWKYYHGEPLSFKNLAEEAAFFTSIGRTEEVRNPVSGYYDWTLEQALQAIKDGVGHGFTNGMLPIANVRSISVKRFLDENLGRRVAAATLEGFAVAS